jgi:hypothetical protein
MKTKIIKIQIGILFLFSILLLAQDKKSMKEKINNIEGDVSKIVITSDKGELTFEGDEAQKIFKRIKSPKMEKHIKWISDDNHEIDGDDVLIFKSEDGKKHIIKHKGKGDKMMMFMNDDFEGKKTIEVEIEDDSDESEGEKTVTVTTVENGEKKVETYKGKKADEYLDKMEDVGEIIIDIDTDIKGDSKHVWVMNKPAKMKDIDKKIEVKLENDIKTVTVTTTEEGEEKVKVYTGKEADEFLKKLEKEDKMKVEEKIIDGKKYKKIIIKEIEEEDLD